MAETKQLGVWGWFARAFAGGVGAMFGIMTALAFACVACYALFAVGLVAISSFRTDGVVPAVSFGGPASYPSPTAESLPSAYRVGTGASAVYPPAQQQATYVNDEPAFDPYATAPGTYAPVPAELPSFKAPELEPASPSTSNQFVAPTEVTASPEITSPAEASTDGTSAVYPSNSN